MFASLRAEYIKPTWMDASGVRKRESSMHSAYGIRKYSPYFEFFLFFFFLFFKKLIPQMLYVFGLKFHAVNCSC